MTINVYPEPSASELPFGAESEVIKGTASQGGFNYTSTLSDGVYLINANGPDDAVFYASDGEWSTEVPTGQYNYIQLLTSTSNFKVNKIFPLEFNSRQEFRNFSYYPNYISNVGYIGVAEVQSPDGAALVSSTDLINWTTRFNWASSSALITNTAQGEVVSGNGYYAARALANAIVISTDGINWTSSAIPSMGNGGRIYYYNGYFWWHSLNGENIKTSTNLVNWTTVGVATTRTSGRMSYGVGPKGHVVGSNGIVTSSFTNYVFSSNGTTWSSNLPLLPGQAGTTSGFPVSVAYGNGRFVIVGGLNGNALLAIWNSTNGTTWTYVRPFTSTAPLGAVVHYTNGLFWLRPNSNAPESIGTIFYSVDGISWVTAGAIGAPSVVSPVNGEGRTIHVAGGGDVSSINNSYTPSFPTTTEGASIFSTPKWGYFELYKMPSSGNIN